jgi:hypothetical protein
MAPRPTGRQLFYRTSLNPHTSLCRKINGKKQHFVEDLEEIFIIFFRNVVRLRRDVTSFSLLIPASPRG